MPPVAAKMVSLMYPRPDSPSACDTFRRRHVLLPWHDHVERTGNAPRRIELPSDRSPPRSRRANSLASVKLWECPPSVDVVTATDWPCWMEVSCDAVNMSLCVGSGPDVV